MHLFNEVTFLEKKSKIFAVTLPLSYHSTFLKRPKGSLSQNLFSYSYYLVDAPLEETSKLQC